MDEGETEENGTGSLGSWFSCNSVFWWNRNQCIFNLRLMSISAVFTMLQNCLKTRLESVYKSESDRKDIAFLQRVNLM